MLPRITPNISFHSQQFANPLGDYLESLAKVRALHPDEVFPAHEYRFSGLDERLDVLERPPCGPPARNRADSDRNARASPAGTPRWRSPGRGLGRTSPTTCSERPTVRPWPTWCCSSGGAGSGARPPYRPGSTWPSSPAALRPISRPRCKWARRPAQLRRNDTLHQARRRHDGQVMRRSNFPRGIHTPIGNWKITRSRSPMCETCRHRWHSTMKLPRSANGLSEVARTLSDSGRAPEYSARFPTGRAVGRGDLALLVGGVGRRGHPEERPLPQRIGGLAPPGLGHRSHHLHGRGDLPRQVAVGRGARRDSARAAAPKDRGSGASANRTDLGTGGSKTGSP